MMRKWLSVLSIFALSIAIVGVALAQNAPAPSAGPSPIATADGETSGTQVQVKSLKRVGDTLMLQMTVVNNSDSAFKMYGELATAANSDADAVTLIDLANKKKYEVIRDADKNCLCSRNLGDVPPKGSLTIYAKFPAPPDSVQKIEVNAPHFMPMDDVPISQ